MVHSDKGSFFKLGISMSLELILKNSMLRLACTFYYRVEYSLAGMLFHNSGRETEEDATH